MGRADGMGAMSVRSISVKQVLIGLLVIAAVASLAYMHVVSQTYHPVVRLASPEEGLIYTTVQDEVAERRACGAANDRFLKPIKSLCKQCQVVYARCERKLEGFEAALAEGRCSTTRYSRPAFASPSPAPRLRRGRAASSSPATW
jgi:hypothetical protein